MNPNKAHGCRIFPHWLGWKWQGNSAGKSHQKGHDFTKALIISTHASDGSMYLSWQRALVLVLLVCGPAISYNMSSWTVIQGVSQDWKTDGLFSDVQSSAIGWSFFRCTVVRDRATNATMSSISDHMAIFFITKVLRVPVYVCCRLIVNFPKNHVLLSLKEGISCSFSTKSVVVWANKCRRKPIQVCGKNFQGFFFNDKPISDCPV